MNTTDKKASIKSTTAVKVDASLLPPLLRAFSGAELKIYMWFVIATRNGKQPTQDTLVELSEATGLTTQTVFVTLKKLVSDKYISRKAFSAKKPVIKLLKPLR